MVVPCGSEVGGPHSTRTTHPRRQWADTTHPWVISTNKDILIQKFDFSSKLQHAGYSTYMLKNSVQNLVIGGKLFQLFLLSEEYYRWDLHCIFQTLVLQEILFISMNKGSGLHEDLLPTCWIWASQDYVTFWSREGNLLALAGPGISQRYKSPLEEGTLQKIPPSPSSHTCTFLLPPLSCRRESEASPTSPFHHHTAMGMAFA